MREHCYRGYQMLKKIPFLTEAAEIVYSHQEFYDGTGYPRGLKGEEIPLGARIFSVADTLDAITSDRPYRKAQSLAAARKEIELLVRTPVRSRRGAEVSLHAGEYLARSTQGDRLPNQSLRLLYGEESDPASYPEFSVLLFSQGTGV